MSMSRRSPGQRIVPLSARVTQSGFDFLDSQLSRLSFLMMQFSCFFFSSRRRHTSSLCDWSSDVCSSDLKQTTPPSWDMNCLEQVCGICTMIINGRARQSCSALVDNLEQPIKLEPMSKFPNIRDLKVDRSQMFDHLRRVHAWVELDGTHDLGPGPRMDQEDVMERYAYSRCMTCGCCLEACPQYDEDHYIGPQAIAQVRLFNMHPSGAMNRDERLEAIMGDDGITNCGNAQNCVKVCPMNIPLTKAIYEENRETVLYGLLGWLKK